MQAKTKLKAEGKMIHTVLKKSFLCGFVLVFLCGCATVRMAPPALT
ncbi:hypothetical protein HHE02_16190 [Helicobacter heilmannii]|nr:hypothetical protein HHE02_16190 [Helicobacter heilmannii]CRF51743.1 hypothetical protein HHE06_16450 [Helicobacter heilmannii]